MQFSEQSKAQPSDAAENYLIGIRKENGESSYYRELPKVVAEDNRNSDAVREIKELEAALAKSEAVSRKVGFVRGTSHKSAASPIRNAFFESETKDSQTSLITPVLARQEGRYFRSLAPAVHTQDLFELPPNPETKPEQAQAKPLLDNNQDEEPVVLENKKSNADPEVGREVSRKRDVAETESETNNETESNNETEKKSDDSVNTRWARKSLRDVRIDIREAAVVAPQDRSNELDYGMGNWFAFSAEPKLFAWCAPNIRYQPLYFEDVALERYGQTLCPRPQTLRSGVHFFRSAFLLPHKMRHDRPGSCDYPLGFCRPGSATPLTDQRHYFGRPR